MVVPQQLLARGKMKLVAGGQLPEQAVLLGGVLRTLRGQDSWASENPA